LCFKRQYLKQNTVAQLISNILTHPKIWAGRATAHVFQLLLHLGKIGLLVDKRRISSRLRTVARKLSIGGFAFVRGTWHSKCWQTLHRFILLHVWIWGAWSFVWGAKLTKAPRGDGTEQTVDKSWISCRSYYFFLKLLWMSTVYVITVAKWRH